MGNYSYATLFESCNVVSCRKESHPLYSHKKLMNLCGSFKVVYLLDMDTER